MSAPRRGGGGAPANAAAKGGALILIAVIIGALLLSKGFADDGGLLASDTNDPKPTVPATDTNGEEDETPDTSDNTTDEGEGEGTTEETPPEDATPRPNNEIHYVVLNGSGVGGAAGRVSSALSALGFVPGEPSNVPGGNVEDSGIYYAEGWKAEGEAVAEGLGVGPELVSPLPAPFEYEMGDTSLLVVLGTDGLIKG